MKLIPLFEQKIEFYGRVSKFLSYWTLGENKALRLYDSNVKSELEKTVTDDNYIVYRGIKCQEEYDDGWKLGDGVDVRELKPGTTLNLKLDSLHSWTKNLDMAKLFANWTYDVINHRYFEDEDYEDHGHESGEYLGHGAVVKAIIPKILVLADLSNIKVNNLNYGSDESEIISLPGEFSVEVISVEKYDCPEFESTDDWDDED